MNLTPKRSGFSSTSSSQIFYLNGPQSAGATWSYNAQLYFQQYYPNFNPGLAISLSTLIGGAVGCFVGGYMADVVVQRVGLYARVLVMAVTQVRQGGNIGGTARFISGQPSSKWFVRTDRASESGTGKRTFECSLSKFSHWSFEKSPKNC